MDFGIHEFSVNIIHNVLDINLDTNSMMSSPLLIKHKIGKPRNTPIECNNFILSELQHTLMIMIEKKSLNIFIIEIICNAIVSSIRS